MTSHPLSQLQLLLLTAKNRDEGSSEDLIRAISDVEIARLTLGAAVGQLKRLLDGH